MWQAVRFGVCVPASAAEAPVDFDLFARTGGMIGTGSVVVLDRADCMVENTRRTLRAIQKDFCKTCASCPSSLAGLLEILDRICKGKAKPDDVEELVSRADRMRAEVSCGPAAAAPHLVLTTIEAFRDEFDAHVRDQRCVAASCRPLIHYTVADSCVGCTLCAQVCPLGAIESKPYTHHEIDHNRCTRCGLCVTTCVEHAIRSGLAQMCRGRGRCVAGLTKLWRVSDECGAGL